MLAKTKKLLIISLIALVPTIVIWLPFFIRLRAFWSIPLTQDGMATIVANYDGPLYLIVAKTLYNLEAIKWNYQFPLSVEYYASHFPLFPFLIRFLAPIFGYPYSMLFITLISSVFALYFFNQLIKQYVSEKEALLMTAFFSIFPARWLIVRSVGSADPLFVAAVIASVYFFTKKKYLLAGIWGVVAQLTKSPGILLFVTYTCYLILPNLKSLFTTKLSDWLKKIEINRIYPVLLIPLSLLLVFGLYQLTFNNFWAYFKSGDNIHLFFPPFKIFNYSAPWVGTFWLEEIIFVYLIGALGLCNLIKQKMGILTWFVAIFFTSTLFVSHRDLIRYSLPIIPFLFVAFRQTIITKDFKFIMILLIIPVYLFSLAFISQNVMPISNWSPFL